MKFLFLFSLTLILLFNSLNCSFQESLFKETNKNFKGKNMIISPLSIFQALSLATNGAQNSTLKEMLLVLQSEDISELNEINFDILEIFKDFSTVEIANAVMTKFTPTDKFTEISEKYLAPTCKLESAQQVNNWCSEKTHGKINKILDRLDDKIIILLLNAVYFKGEWDTEFKKSSTKEKPFYNFGLEEEEKNVEMMRQQNRYRYYQRNGTQAIELNYKKDSMSAVIILPPKEIDINEFIEKANISEIVKGLVPAKVILELPKFELEFTVTLNEVLKKLGMETVFTDDADLGRLKEEKDIKIDSVIHKTYLKVDEEGTEAAAVTVITGTYTTTAVPIPEKIYEMYVNRPFLFLLRNKKFPENYDLLFMSKIEQLK